MVNEKTWKELTDMYYESVSAELSEEEKERKQKVLDLYKRAQLKCKINKYDSALMWYKRAEDLFQKSNFSIKQKRFINLDRYPNSAYIFYSINDFKKAFEYINKTISCLSEVEKEFKVINFAKSRQAHNIIRMFNKQKRYEEYFDWNLYLMNFLMFSEIPNTDNKVDLSVDLIPLVPEKLLTKRFNSIFLELIVNFNTNCEIPFGKVCFFDSFIKRKSEIDQEKFKIFHYFIHCLSSINNEVKSRKESIADNLFKSNDDSDYIYVKILLYVHEIRKHNHLESKKDTILIEHIQQKIQITLSRIYNKSHIEAIKLKLFENGILKQGSLPKAGITSLQ